ncbi:MAG: UPF0149 family protein [Pseudomonadota bacterium]
MTNHEPDPCHSALTQIATRDGKSVSIEIYSDGDGCWLLEVIDEHGNSTVWDLPFDSEQDALDAALETIETEGIDALIGEPGTHPAAQQFIGLLSASEYEELDDFLASPALAASSMDVATLEGFLTSVAIGPRLVPPSAWLPWVWDSEAGEIEPEFDSQEQASHILSLLMGLYNAVLDAFATHPESFQPVFHAGAQYGATAWCEGFLLGFMFDTEAWSLLLVGQPTLFTPFMRLGSEEGRDLSDKASDAQLWADAIEPALLHIHSFWLARRPVGPSGAAYPGQGIGTTLVRAAPKIGRNDSCPCGSGKKFKKCCGAGATPSDLH